MPAILTDIHIYLGTLYFIRQPYAVVNSNKLMIPKITCPSKHK